MTGSIKNVVKKLTDNDMWELRCIYKYHPLERWAIKKDMKYLSSIDVDNTSYIAFLMSIRSKELLREIALFTYMEIENADI